MEKVYLRRLKTGWQADFYHKDQSGNLVRFRRLIGAPQMTLREAEREAKRLKRKADSIGYVPGYSDSHRKDNVRKEISYPFEDFARHWYDTYVVPNNSKNEQRNKECHLRVHLVPYFKGIDLREINKEMVDQFKAEMLKKTINGPPKAKHKGRAGKPLSKNSINKTIGTLRKMLNDAVEWGYISFAPRVTAFKIVQPDPDWFTVEERDLFLETCKKYRAEWYAFFVTAFHTGARMGELAGLKWEDVQFATRMIRIRRTRDREGTEGPPKGKRSRNVPMNSTLYAVLKGHQHLAAPYVFLNSAGQKLDINGGLKVFRWICRKAGLRALRRHDIRHSFASNIVAATGNVVAVKDILGHADITTTMRYSHLAPAQYLDIVEAIVTGENASKNNEKGQVMVNKMVNGPSEGVNSAPGHKEKARKSKDLRAI